MQQSFNQITRGLWVKIESANISSLRGLHAMNNVYTETISAAMTITSFSNMRIHGLYHI